MSLAQSLHLINASDIKEKLASPTGRANRLAKDAGSPEAKVRELYLAALRVEPRVDELKTAMDYIADPRLNSRKARPIEPEQVARENFQDLIWALINTKEFLFNH